MIAATEAPELVPCPEPGLYPDATFGEYRSWRAVNAGTICRGRRSMAHLRHWLRTPPKPATDSMRKGSLIHAAKLEPLALLERYVVMPAFEDQVRKPDGSEYTAPKLSKAYKELVAEFTAANSHREVVSQQWYDDMLGMLEAIRRHGRASHYLGGDGPTELSVVWTDPDTGIKCKARYDKIDHDHKALPDLKTTADAQRFEQTIARFSYHIRGAFYEDGWKAVTGDDYTYCLVAVETEAPYGIRAAPLGNTASAVGRQIYKETLRQCAQAKATNEWPSYLNPLEWSLPSWALPEGENE